MTDHLVGPAVAPWSPPSGSNLEEAGVPHAPAVRTPRTARPMSKGLVAAAAGVPAAAVAVENPETLTVVAAPAAAAAAAAAIGRTRSVEE